MKVKVLKVRISEEFQTTDETLVNDFLSRYDVVNMNSKLVQDEINYWSVLVYYQEKSKQTNSNKVSVNSEEELSEEEKIIYNKLKDWRFEKSKELDQPPYIIFHNTHLMSIAKFKPYNLRDLEQISGLGESKIKKYGTEIIEVLANA
ncbi:superfamily II DNA helicase RecQ [Epilithonimonas hungarica]|uniref:HRDC domain-containing protein n=1 Tax=Epilithonimonas hungarica TaxID=454006 RepID=UPI0027847A78|nr:HRDC domain-containing protein [Epilithonimonas hungarica]MDP9955740.1 superfamily II DNA helicase RecQ [Epilithonimonas hungarica]